jgi:hypothetical protein
MPKADPIAVTVQVDADGQVQVMGPSNPAVTYALLNAGQNMIVAQILQPKKIKTLDDLGVGGLRVK